MSGLGLLKFLSSLRGGAGLDRAVAIAERVMRLDLRRKVRTYSTGMKQKLALAQAFADPVEILILDEPTSALDPSARADVLDLVAEARRSGQTVIFSGHVLSEVEQVADRVAIMRRGRLMHVEDMHDRRGLRMLLVRVRRRARPSPIPDELELTLRSREGGVDLLEHRGAVGPLLGWLHARDVARPRHRDRGPQGPLRPLPRPRRPSTMTRPTPMSAFLSLIRKNLLDSRWMLGGRWSSPCSGSAGCSSTSPTGSRSAMRETAGGGGRCGCSGGWAGRRWTSRRRRSRWPSGTTRSSS